MSSYRSMEMVKGGKEVRFHNGSQRRMRKGINEE